MSNATVAIRQEGRRFKKEPLMPRLVVRSFAMSIDATALPRTRASTIPVNSPELMEWFFQTRVWREMHGQSGGDTGVDNELATEGFERGRLTGENGVCPAGHCLPE